jgi:hypothetical protein
VKYVQAVVVTAVVLILSVVIVCHNLLCLELYPEFCPAMKSCPTCALNAVTVVPYKSCIVVTFSGTLHFLLTNIYWNMKYYYTIQLVESLLC